MDKENFKKRVDCAVEKGLLTTENLDTIGAAVDSFLRLRAVYAQHPEFFEAIKSDYQGRIAIDTLSDQETMDKTRLLANDGAYDAVALAAIFNHPCQRCAEDPNAWHTRAAFCEHQKSRGF